MKTNIINWIMDNIENGKIDENQVVVVYDKNNNIEYLGKAQFAPLCLWDEFKHAEYFGSELRINERQVEVKKPISNFEILSRVNNMYNIFLAIMRLNEHRFKDYHIDTVIDSLYIETGVDLSYVPRQKIANRIKEYCENHDTGIFY